MFGRNKFGKWKTYEKGVAPDSNTLPFHSSIFNTENYVEVGVLGGIAKEIMTTTDTVTYSLDGSARNGVGKYVVQTLKIGEVERRLPTFPIFSETNESLTDYFKTTLKMLSASSGYTEKDLS